MANDDLIKEYEELFQMHADKLPHSSTKENPKMEYHTLADGVLWEDEGLIDDEYDDLDLENPFRFVIHYRTFLITNEGEPAELSKRVYELAKMYFPNWIGFTKSRCEYNATLAHRIARIDKLFNE